MNVTPELYSIPIIICFQNYIDLKMKYDATASTNAEYEKTLEELGVHLSK
jgi:hypothetical protein